MTTIRTAEHAMDPTTRKAALAAGLFYIGTFVFSIPALGLYDGVLNDPNFVLGADSDQGSASPPSCTGPASSPVGSRRSA